MRIIPIFLSAILATRMSNLPTIYSDLVFRIATHLEDKDLVPLALTSHQYAIAFIRRMKPSVRIWIQFVLGLDVDYDNSLMEKECFFYPLTGEVIPTLPQRSKWYLKGLACFDTDKFIEINQSRDFSTLFKQSRKYLTNCLSTLVRLGEMDKFFKIVHKQKCNLIHYLNEDVVIQLVREAPNVVLDLLPFLCPRLLSYCLVGIGARFNAQLMNALATMSTIDFNALGRAFVKAAQYNNIEFIQFLIERGIIHIISSERITTSFKEAAKYGNLTFMKTLTDFYEENPTILKFGMTKTNFDSMIYAAINGHTDCIKFYAEKYDRLPELYPEVNLGFRNNELLQFGIQKGNIELVKYLLWRKLEKNDTSISFDWISFNGPFVTAVKSSQPKMVSLLFRIAKRYPFLELNPAERRNEPLLLACQNDQVEIVELFLRQKS